MVRIDPTAPLPAAVLRVLVVVVASLVVAVGFFDRSVPYAITVGVVVGALYAVVGHYGVRLTP